MCGVAGFWDPKQRYDRERLASIIDPMIDQLRHRGPDRGGSFVDETAGLAVGVRRLAINDLSSDGDQPMHSSCGRWTITLNGEIYNFRALRHELEAAGERFRGHADTEVLLKLIERHGLDEALRRSVGMFAFALWDRKEKSLTFVRDRLGKKPLYLGWIGGQLAYGSELKALAVHPSFSADVNRDAIALYLLHQHVPAPHSIWHGIIKLPPGTSLTMTETDLKHGRDLLELVKPFWQIRDIAERGVRDELAIDQESAIERADELLKLAVSERMIADVPLGAFLSGGIDSSLIVALMQQAAAKPIKTFTVGFNEKDFSEAEQASKVARHLGTDHTEFLLTPEETLDVALGLPDIYDEPFADPSQVPTYHVAKKARDAVTVCLSGDGGDEVFGGYGRYQMATSLDRRFRHLPSPLRRLTATML
ncbi:MAG: asparagine synthase (glutamine-hydrolyzing), partial [Geminicoccaceae bacterium]